MALSKIMEEGSGLIVRRESIQRLWSIRPGAQEDQGGGEGLQEDARLRQEAGEAERQGHALKRRSV